MTEQQRSSGVRPPSARTISDQVLSWPGVTVHDHRFGGLEFRVGKRQLGHLHGDRIADIPLRRALRDELVAAGRVRVHRWRPDSGWVTVDIDSEKGRDEAVRLLRAGYDSALRARDRRAASAHESS
jgi:Luciferase